MPKPAASAVNVSPYADKPMQQVPGYGLIDAAIYVGNAL